jgi:hypothetical protein
VPGCNFASEEPASPLLMWIEFGDIRCQKTGNQPKAVRKPKTKYSHFLNDRIIKQITFLFEKIWIRPQNPSEINWNPWLPHSPRDEPDWNLQERKRCKGGQLCRIGQQCVESPLIEVMDLKTHIVPFVSSLNLIEMASMKGKKQDK